ncbi:MAG: ABC transporter permease [Chloroflexota bacterium]
MGLGSEDSIERSFTYEWASGVFVPILSVVLALVAGGLVVLSAGSNPLTAYTQLFQGALGSRYAISETILASIPLMLAGMSVAFAFRAGLFNIGAEGQLFIGAIFSAWVGYTFNFPAIVLIPLALVAGALGGAAWAGIVGILKAWRGAHEVITTIMLNYIAINLSHYLLEPGPTGQPGPMEQHAVIGNPETAPMNAHLPVIVPNFLIPGARLHAGLFVACFMGLAFWFILWRTTLGYRIRAVGLNPKAASYAGIHVGWHVAGAMAIAGLFSGLAGMIAIFGVAPYQLTDSFSPGYGFDAIAVALLGKNTALGTIIAALLFGVLEHGAGFMQAQTGISSHLTEIVQGLIIFFIGADAIVRYLSQRGLVRLSLHQHKVAA